MAAGASPERFRLILLGAAQDAGVPQVGCACANCEAVWRGDTPERLGASAALVGPSGDAFLIDATPHLTRQWRLLQRRAPGFALRGVLLTHCHMGHYTGLLQLGKEGANVRALRVLATPSACAFLRSTEPYATGVRDGNFVLEPLQPRSSLELAPGLAVVALPVPHRSEYSDCVAFEVRGARAAALYLPDIDSWAAWDEAEAAAERYGALRAAVARVDVALLDATFFDAGELPPGRDPASIPHPVVVDTLRALGPEAAAAGGGPAGAGAAGRAQVVLVHLNHTSPLWRADSEQRRRVDAAGFRVGSEGDEFEL